MFPLQHTGKVSKIGKKTRSVMKYFTMLLAVIGLSFASYWVVISARRPVPAAPLREPAQNAYVKTLAGAGIIESAGRNINVNPPIPGQVSQVWVKENDVVKRGKPLYQIDDREQRAKLASAEAAIARAEATVATLQADIATQQAAQASASANVTQLTALLEESEQILTSNDKLYNDGVIPYLTYLSSLKARDAARARVTQAQAQVVQAQALESAAQARVREAESSLQVLKTEREELMITLQRLTVVAPQDGRVLQVNVREGEFLASTTAVPPILLGETDMLQVRVDIDEINASRFTPGSPAIASLKGDSSRKISLEFVRVDPYILPKRNLTGDNTERVDIRVLQVIYRFRPPDFPVYVGQQVEVFVDAADATLTNNKISGSKANSESLK
jgi:HlyD family secretion protein